MKAKVIGFIDLDRKRKLAQKIYHTRDISDTKYKAFKELGKLVKNSI